MLLRGYGRAVVETEPACFDNRLANGDIAANPVNLPDSEKLNGNLAVERSVVLFDKIIKSIDSRCRWD